MNCEPRYSISIPFTVAKKVFFLLLLYNITIYGQSNKTGYNDIKKQRLLVHITADYLHTISQGQIDMDSAVRTSCKIYDLSILIPYNEIYSNGKSTIETQLLEQGKVKKAQSLLMALKGENRLLLLLELSSYYLFKPGSQKGDLDQAENYINKVLREEKITKWKIGALMLKAYLLHQRGLTEESQKLFSTVEELCKQTKNYPDQARALLNAGQALQYGHPMRLAKFEKALSIFHAHQEKEKEIETLSQINVEYFIARRYKESEKLIRKIVKLQKEIKYHHNQYAFDVLSYLSYREGDLLSALSYSNKSIASMRSKADSTFKSIFFSRRAGLYQYLKKNEDALAWYKKALENRSEDTKLYWYKTFLVTVELLNSMGRYTQALSLLKETGSSFPARTDFEKMHYALLLGETYENLKKTDLAEKNYKIFLNSIQNFPTDHVHDEFPAAFFRISAFYRNRGKTALARELLHKGINPSFEIGHAKKSEYYYNLFKIDSTEHKYADAIKNLQLSQKFKDSAFGKEQQKKIAELFIKYEADKKDKSIKILNTQNQLQHIRSQQAERAKNIILIGALLLLVIIGLLLNRYIIKQKSNRKLEANQRELDQKNVFLETLNMEQEKLLKEKEWLIKEVHHRVKNNLQMVTSLLNSQSLYLEDDDAKMAVKDSLRRMQAMAMIHQKLYQDDTISTIAMPEYISDLVHYLHESFDSENQIVFEKNIAPIALDLSQAIPLGLIITESIVNAIKYAFLEGQKGIINISLQPDGNDSLLLKISDNGIGLTSFPEKSEHYSLGHDLMQGLTKQLKGSFTIENNNGVHIMVKFIHLNK
ncbi:sensor histidine kinase [Flavobacterium sp. LC2016-23]|nr:sensor histidine kinase [Flavobacterium sp. LC2016-23]